MKHWLLKVLWLILWGLSGVALAMAGEWPKTEAVLSAWDGPKELVLRSDLGDPLASPDIQGLLETLLENGFVVTPASLSAPPGEGLALDFRQAGDYRILALSRGADGAIIAFERQGAVPATGSRQAPVGRQMVGGAAGGGGTGPLKLQGRPRSVALVDVGDGDVFDIAVLSDRVLETYRLQSTDLRKIDTFRPSLPSTRALHLSAGDLTGDGRREIAAVWAEDILSVYEGTDSKLHGWILGRREGAFSKLSPDLSGYLRILGRKGFFQSRDLYAPYGGPVLPLVMEGDEFRAGNSGVDWAGVDLFRATPLGNGDAMIWNDVEDLQLVSQASGEGYPGAVLLGGFSGITGPEVAVRLENPVYRAGFEKEDQVKERYHPLASRMAIGPGGAVYTVLRGRSPGLPLLGKASGKDTLVRVAWDGKSLHLQRPFADVEAFVLDFALVERPGGPLGAILLLNEQEDGSGQAYLLFQESRQYN